MNCNFLVRCIFMCTFIQVDLLRQGCLFKFFDHNRYKVFCSLLLRKMRVNFVVSIMSSGTYGRDCRTTKFCNRIGM